LLGVEVELVVAGAKGNSRVFESARLDPLPPRVQFTGYVSDEQLPCLYSGALALVYPSLYEGFGLPPLEAMACGTPVVTSNGTSLPEVAADVAVLVDPEDIDSIAEGIQRVVASSALRDNMRLLGLDRASQTTWDSAAQRTLQLLEEQARS
jgi:glycosyltransferase involved in cell wall biosynthesis